MRKILVFCFCLCLTGCIVSNEDFEKTCSKTIKSNNLNDITNIHVSYDNEDNINSAVYIKRYEAYGDDGLVLLKNIKESGTLFNEKYAFNDNIKISLLYNSNPTLNKGINTINEIDNINKTKNNNLTLVRLLRFISQYFSFSYINF